MRHLGIHVGHNATAALSIDGRVVAVLSQEKIDGVKNSAAFPCDAIRTLLESNSLKPDDIDKVVIASTGVFPERCYNYLFHPKNKIERTLMKEVLAGFRKSFLSILPRTISQLYRDMRAKALNEEGLLELESELKALGLATKPREYVDHHTCHAMAAYYSLSSHESSQPSLVFTLDGGGDGISAAVFVVDDAGQWKRLTETPVESSLGGVYSHTTRFLGMKMLEHEYKVMGLAPYAKNFYRDVYERIFKPIIWLDAEKLQFVSAVDTTQFYEYLSKTAVGERFDNIAGALQHLTEELVCSWILAAIKATGIRRIFTGGGVFMNVKLNKKIQELNDVEEVFFMPSCGDESNPIGAVYHSVCSAGEKPAPLDNLYLGVGYGDDEILKYIEENKLGEEFQVERMDDPAEQIAQLLSERKIVARFSGRCEWGARSLGNRAILGHPSFMESFYEINNQIKCRDFWMPFAPSILDTAAEKYLQGYSPDRTPAPYMITAFSATQLGKDHLRAAIHQGDNTLRPQVITSSANADYYNLIAAFERRTGVGAVLNTSLNVHGNPLVATLDQACWTFTNSGLSYLALGPYLLSKRQES